jgi:hypothetical protein
MASFTCKELDPLFELPKLGPLLTIDDFAAHVGETFAVETTPQPVGIVLEAIDTGPGEAWMARQPFVLVFSSPWEVLLVEAQYLVKPAGIGPGMTLHLMPINTPPGGRRRYQAVFN